MMARQEKDREDLMAEAANLVQRCELQLPGQEAATVAGFRRDGRLSIYFDPDYVLHFDLAGRIRRAFVAEKLYRAEKGRLVELTRHRTEYAVFLEPHRMTDEETVQWLQEAQRRTLELDQALESATCQVLRAIPSGAGAEVVGRLRQSLQTLRDQPLTLAASPRSL